jgi:hypothetical protein
LTRDALLARVAPDTGVDAGHAARASDRVPQALGEIDDGERLVARRSQLQDATDVRESFCCRFSERFSTPELRRARRSLHQSVRIAALFRRNRLQQEVTVETGCQVVDHLG